MHPARIVEAGPEDARAMAALHRHLFDPPWSDDSIAALMAPPTGFALAAILSPPCPSRGGLAGFLLARAAAGEAEILTIGVAPECQRQGLARRLLENTFPALSARGARRLFLEVADDNAAALALYRGLGFSEAGRRRAYYARRAGPAADALILARDL